MRYLVVDTCTERGIIAYGSHEEVLFETELPFGLNQSKFLMPALQEAFKPFGIPPEIEAIGVGMGPGSYTGIRIGVALAQALAYGWEVPLIGIPSLQGFFPSVTSAHFAAILDARIGGVYFQKGTKRGDEVHYEQEPRNCPLEEFAGQIAGVTHLVSPCIHSLQAKLGKLFPHAGWIWEERSPSARLLLKHVARKHAKGEEIMPPQHLNLLYLRQTEAEREKLQQKRHQDH